MKRLALVVTVCLLASLFVAVPASATNIGREGCTPGFWKTHPNKWEDYDPDDILRQLTGQDFPDRFEVLETKTFMEALNWGGGDTLRAAAKMMLKHAVAAFLNAAHEDVAYPYRRFSLPGNLRQMVIDALASEDRDTILDLKNLLDTANNDLDCPINNGPG